MYIQIWVPSPRFSESKKANKFEGLRLLVAAGAAACVAIGWLAREDKQVVTILYFLILYSPGVIPVSRLKNLEKNEALGKFSDSAICQTGRSLYFNCSLAC